MKAIVYVVCFCLGAFAAMGQNEGKPLPASVVSINPLGFLQFGPVIQGEFQLGSNRSYLSPFLRIAYLGLLYQAIASEGFENTVKPLALGLGLQYKYLNPGPKGAWYFGLGGDYSFGATSGDEGTSFEWEGKHAYLAVMANAGYRWRNPSKKIFIGIGILAGPAIALKDDWWYLSDPQFKFDDSQNYIFAMGEFVIGWERVKK